ncbi:MAG: DUF4232 domain-containing protein, partial [Candidatus Dormibacteraeota bacterium]|nr:DUF4232 domain-containing protein [Candidatus Dormibacteraeota bacterium]
MRNRLEGWLDTQPVPPELHARVMGDRRLGAPRGLLRTRLAFATTALVVLVVGGGLGSVLLRGNRPQGTVGTLPSSTTPTVTPAPSPSPSPILNHPEPALAPPRPCRTTALDITLGQSQGAAGTRYTPVTARNHASPCTLSGYFGVALLDASGKQIGSDPTRDPDTSSSTPSAGVLLPTGSTASFTFRWSNVQS